MTKMMAILPSNNFDFGCATLVLEGRDGVTLTKPQPATHWGGSIGVSVDLGTCITWCRL
jgi:hypothetical protein